MSFSFVNHSLIWTWTFTLCKMHIVSKTTSLTRVAIYLLLTSQGLFKLHLLLDFLLFVGKDWMLTLWRFKRICHIHHIIFLFDWRNIHWVSHCSWITHIWNECTLLLLSMNVSSSLQFIIDLLTLSLIIDWRIVTALNHWIWNTFMLILIWVILRDWRFD